MPAVVGENLQFILRTGSTRRQKQSKAKVDSNSSHAIIHFIPSSLVWIIIVTVFTKV